MRQIPRAALGALLLCAAASLTACASNGSKPSTSGAAKTPVLVTEVRQQLTPIPDTMTEPPALPDLPRPDVFDAAGCKNGCYSGKQFDAALTTALGWGVECAGKLLGVRDASHKAATP